MKSVLIAKVIYLYSVRWYTTVI